MKSLPKHLEGKDKSPHELYEIFFSPQNQKHWGVCGGVVCGGVHVCVYDGLFGFLAFVSSPCVKQKKNSTFTKHLYASTGERQPL